MANVTIERKARIVKQKKEHKHRKISVSGGSGGGNLLEIQKNYDDVAADASLKIHLVKRDQYQQRYQRYRQRMKQQLVIQKRLKSFKNIVKKRYNKMVEGTKRSFKMHKNFQLSHREEMVPEQEQDDNGDEYLTNVDINEKTQKRQYPCNTSPSSNCGRQSVDIVDQNVMPLKDSHINMKCKLISDDYQKVNDNQYNNVIAGANDTNNSSQVYTSFTSTNTYSSNEGKSILQGDEFLISDNSTAFSLSNANYRATSGDAVNSALNIIDSILKTSISSKHNIKSSKNDIMELNRTKNNYTGLDLHATKNDDVYINENMTSSVQEQKKEEEINTMDLNINYQQSAAPSQFLITKELPANLNDLSNDRNSNTNNKCNAITNNSININPSSTINEINSNTDSCKQPDFFFPTANHYSENQQNFQQNVMSNNIEKIANSTETVFIQGSSSNNNNRNETENDNSPTTIYENHMYPHYMVNAANENQSIIKNDNDYDKKDFFLYHHPQHNQHAFVRPSFNDFSTPDQTNNILNYKESFNGKVEELNLLNTLNISTNKNDEVNSKENRNFDLITQKKLNNEEQQQELQKQEQQQQQQDEEKQRQLQQDLYGDKFLNINVTHNTYDNQQRHNHNQSYHQSCELYNQTLQNEELKREQQQQDLCSHAMGYKTYEEQQEQFLEEHQMNEHHHLDQIIDKKYCVDNSIASITVINNQHQEGHNEKEKDHFHSFLKSNAQQKFVSAQSPLHRNDHIDNQNQNPNQIIQDVYRDIIMNDYHEDTNFRYKVNLSPENVKPENQDDGYETSVGDVLAGTTSHPSLELAQQQHHHHKTRELTLLPPSHHGVCYDGDSKVTYMQSQNDNSVNAIRHLKSPPNMYIGNIKTMSHNSNDRNYDVKKNKPSSNFDSRGEDDDVCHRNEVDNILTSTSVSQPQVNRHSTNYCNSDRHTSPNNAYNTQGTELLNECIESHQNSNLEQNLYYSKHSELNDKYKYKNESYEVISESNNCIEPKEEFTATVNQCLVSPSLENVNPLEVQAINIKMKERKKHDRFNGMTEEEVVKRTLPDHLSDNLDIVIIGINPGLFAAYKGHHYAGPGNHFWKCLYLSGLTQVQMSAEEDYKLIKYGIGFTNMVQRATKGSADLTRKEIKNGSKILLEKLQRFRPKIAVFNGKLIFEVFSGKKDFNFGRQPECVEGTDTFIWVMPSSSARCAQLPRAADKVPFYTALKKFRDYLNGLVPNIDEAEYIFTEERIKQHYEQEQKTFKNVEVSEITSQEQQLNCITVNNDVGNGAYAESSNCVQNSHITQARTYDSMHGVCNGPGPPLDGGNKFLLTATTYLNDGQIPEKKKRGRPKKIHKLSMAIDPISPTNMQQLPIGFNDCINKGSVLNLSLTNGGSNDDNITSTPKKKRGRPKKIKQDFVNVNELRCSHHQDLSPTKSHNLLVQNKSDFNSYNEESNSLPQKQISSLHIINNNNNHIFDKAPQRYLTTTASPVDIPSEINLPCTTITPPMKVPDKETVVGVGGDDLVLEDKSSLQLDSKASLEINFNHTHPSAQSYHHIQIHSSLEKSPQNENRSPKNVTRDQLDFDEPMTSAFSSKGETISNDIKQSLVNQENVQRDDSRLHYINRKPTIDDNFQQWLTAPKHSRYSPTPASYTLKHLQQQQQLQQQQEENLSLQQSSQQRIAETLHYEQHQHIQHNLRMQHDQSMHPQWSRHHPYLNMTSNPYILPVSQYHHSRSLSHQNTPIDMDYHHLIMASPRQSSDIARKSLTGLETLVEQIPTINENHTYISSSTSVSDTDTINISTNVTDLQGQHIATSFSDSSIQRNNYTDHPINNTITEATNGITVDNRTHESRQKTNINGDSSTPIISNDGLAIISSQSGYSSTTSVQNNDSYTLNQVAPCSPHNNNAYHMHHTNLQMAAAVFAGVTVSSAHNNINHHHNQHIVTHPQMYMDPHTHIASQEPMNSLYSAAYHERPAIHQPHYHTSNSTHPLHSSEHYSSPQHFTVRSGEYASNSYQSNGTHMLHLPSPNYPYGFAATTTQRNYIPYNHHNAGQPHAHLSMFDSIKSSNISSYGGF